MDRPDLGGRQSRRRCAGTGRLIVERTRALLAAPDMETTRRHSQEPQHPRPSSRRSPVRRNPDVRNRASASRSSALSLRTCRRSLQDLRSELRLRKVRTIQTDHGRRRRAQPATRRRARDAEVRGDGHVAGALDEIPKSVVVALLRTGRGRHGPDHRPFAHAAQLARGRWGSVRRRDDNSRGQVQNVRGDSSSGIRAATLHAPWSVNPNLPLATVRTLNGD
jgi:hypothetical protein